MLDERVERVISFYLGITQQKYLTQGSILSWSHSYGYAIVIKIYDFKINLNCSMI